jgi:polyhydroxyalkanoate synthesis repressor PhaR
MIEIKKYSNRRLYNTETSAYITLDDIVTLIKKELDFKVVDVDTQTDITSSILTQIILEKENAGINLIPSHILKQIILFNENKKNNMMFDFLNTTMNSANSNNIFAKNFPNFADFNFF